jgi:DNA-binding transcriptional MerR regulator
MAEPRPETRYAKQLWLYGAGDGAPVKNIPKLAELSGVTCETIRRYLPQWEKESTEILANTSEMGLAIVLSGEKVQQHEKDMLHLRNLVEANIWETTQLEEITAKLEGWMDKFQGGDTETALRIFDSWQRASASKSGLQSQFLALQKQWTSLVGIVDLKDISVVKQKEIAKGQGKLAVKAMEAETGPTVRNVSGSGVFARPSVDA